tara:strand:+ start:1425 stop:1664 length:240 start_codon:yes stop_codon:yes gene_type:complete
MSWQEVGSGSLHKNESAQGKQPAYGGPIEIEGKKYRMSAWVNEKDGKRYFSIKVNEQVQDDQTSTSQGRPAILDEEIPF